MIETQALTKKIIRKFSYNHFLLFSALVVYCVIFFGVMIRSNGTTCPDWPACFGTFVPPEQDSALIDYLHRMFTGAAFIMVNTALIHAVMRYRSNKPLVKSLLGASLGILVQVLIGALFALDVIASKFTGVVHLGISLVVMSFILSATVSFHESTEDVENFVTLRSSYTKHALGVMIAVFVMYISGSIVSVTDAGQACASWPLCNSNGLPVTLMEWINFTHRAVVLLSGIAVLLFVRKSWHTQRNHTGILVTATASGVLFISQALLGSVLVARSLPISMTLLHTFTTNAIWVSVSLNFLLALIASRGASDENSDLSLISQRNLRQLGLDFLMMTKPIVVALLLVTTLAGMVIGAKAWPDFGTLFWTLFGGFLAAGGSGAINQYIDRYDDMKMQRTARRPIPSGRLTAAEGLAFGVAISIVSFYVLVVFVNMLAAILSLVGIVYYVVLYSLLLKKTTAQNIVIGGGAGAIPPLVGWAAATGNLTIPSFLLFAVVFMWTPPHFWALAIVRKKDYARAGVPMLPVVKGEKETRWQVFLYTLELVLLTLLLPVFGLGSSIYLVSAIVLGMLLLGIAYQVWKIEGNKIAWKMYRYSSMYLAFLFFALMIDRLIL